uniref:DUF3253 domain-containing protein n=1 Tax=Pararhizobium sp. IMCC3301 TaxID=3067904 RepID=UPI002740E08F|nr:DUF3253 domain-containing protein [Pararhizobium sp. IMCC3301]
MSDLEHQIDTAIFEHLASCAAHKTICPSQIARALAGSDEKQWRLLMRPIRTRAIALARADRLVIKRKGKPVDPSEGFKGIYRLGNAKEEPER